MDPQGFSGSVPSRNEYVCTGENIVDVDIEHFCAAVIHPDTGETITKYELLANDKNNPGLSETWKTAFRKEVGRMAQSNDKTKTKGKK